MYSWADEEEEEEDESFDGKYGGKNLTIFLVDGTKSMMSKLEGDEECLTGIQRAFSCAHATIKNKIFQSDKDCVGVILFGSESCTSEGSDFPNVRQVLPLSRPCSESILKLEEFMDGITGSNLIESKFKPGVQGDVKLHEALWQCQSMFATIPGKIGGKTIILMTNNSTPHGGNSKLDVQARRKAGDLHGTDIFLDVVPVVGDSQQFCMDKFYCDLIKLADDTAPVNTTSLADLADTVVKRTSVKRSTGKFHFQIGGVTIAVSSYNLVSKTSKPAKQKLSADTNETVSTSRTWVHPITGAPLLPSDMNKFQNYGGKNICFTHDEVKNVSGLGSDQTPLKLCGFKPISSLKPSLHVRGPQFLQPAESNVVGSRTVFSALLSRCLARKVMAVCQYKPRSISNLSYVALLPQEEEMDEVGNQVKPPGFHVIFLPYLDDLRKVPVIEPLTTDNPPEAVEAAKEVIKKLRLKQFVPVENGSLQNHYRMIEAHALRRDTLVKVEDQTLPDTERMLRKLGDKSLNFINSVYEDGYEPEAPPKKKPTSAATKVKEKNPMLDNIEEMDMRSMVKAGSVNKLTVDVLKAWLKGKGFAVGNKKKGELVDLVMNCKDNL